MDKPHLFLLSAIKDLREELSSILRSEFAVSSFVCGRDFLNALKRERPHGVVMDLSIEDIRPFDLIDKVRNSPVTRDLAFILVSRDSSNESLEKAVRAGISHFVGVPFEPDVLIQKIRRGFELEAFPYDDAYFSVYNEQHVKLAGYGRISYISKEGIHFECRLRPPLEATMHLVCPLSKELGLQSLEVVVKNLSRDVFYNYPFAIDADWKTEAQSNAVSRWIKGHQHLNSPKKSKILFVGFSQEEQNELLQEVGESRYSIRYEDSLPSAIERLPFLKPACLIVKATSFLRATDAEQKSFQAKVTEYQSKVILVQDCDWTEMPDELIASTILSPNVTTSIKLSVEQNVILPSPEPDRLYFSKSLEDSRVKIFFHGKTIRIGELGCELALEYEVFPPGNFQLDLKALSDQNLRNPYVRIFPPVRRLSGSQTEGGRFGFAAVSHFLGIDDHHGQALRLFVRDAEMKSRREDFATIAPVMGEPIPAESSKQPEAKPEDTKKPRSWIQRLFSK